MKDRSIPAHAQVTLARTTTGPRYLVRLLEEGRPPLWRSYSQAEVGSPENAIMQAARHLEGAQAVAWWGWL